MCNIILPSIQDSTNAIILPISSLDFLTRNLPVKSRWSDKVINPTHYSHLSFYHLVSVLFTFSIYSNVKIILNHDEYRNVTLDK